MKSIRTRILAGSCLVTAVFVLLLGAVSAVLSYTSTFGQVQDNMQSMAGIAAQRVEWELADYASIAEAFGGRTELADPDVPAEEKEALLNLWAEEYGLVSANLLRPNGLGVFDGQNYATESISISA